MDKPTPRRAWDEGLSTGVATMDADHRLQAAMVDALEDALQRGETDQVLEEMAARLRELTAVHFRSEEAMMRLHAYPVLGTHAEEHGRLLAQLDIIRSAALAQDIVGAIDLVASLRTWHASHVRTMDKGFALWCARSGIQPGKA